MHTVGLLQCSVPFLKRNLSDLYLSYIYLTYLVGKIMKFANLVKNCWTRLKKIFLFCIRINLLPYFFNKQFWKSYEKKILLIFELLNFVDFSWTFAYFLSYLTPAPFLWRESRLNRLGVFGYIMFFHNFVLFGLSNHGFIWKKDG